MPRLRGADCTLLCQVARLGGQEGAILLRRIHRQAQLCKRRLGLGVRPTSDICNVFLQLSRLAFRVNTTLYSVPGASRVLHQPSLTATLPIFQMRKRTLREVTKPYRWQTASEGRGSGSMPRDCMMWFGWKEISQMKVSSFCLQGRH